MAHITKTFTFEASHMLPGHKGKCARLHGHSYEFTAAFKGPIRQVRLGSAFETDTGMVVDYYDVSAVAKPFIEKYLDHYYLNETLLDLPRTTAELIACWIFGAFYKARLPILDVTVYETRSSSAVVNYSDWVDNFCYCPGKTDAEVDRIKQLEIERRVNHEKSLTANHIPMQVLINAKAGKDGNWTAEVPAEAFQGESRLTITTDTVEQLQAAFGREDVSFAGLASVDPVDAHLGIVKKEKS